ncbi:ER membrane protein Wsc4, putative [Paecilomyces variotii No. 5]|uniref:ER membrane protein Wsc4, putative n=1 Tax=Byssochlamys spectabilis (strain No. 5 / NBRC 109023) TaxID=1356009 RepID=V5FDP8_BYSSN|nr:ER membrane protein Wsc4, putative [Paecilomyces variotii No. 5]
MAFSTLSMMRLALLAGVAMHSVLASEDIAYCSSQNTGSDFDAQASTYQSYGLCYQSCSSKYAYAILQGHDCWCSDFAPSSTTSADDCAETCPGYKSDKCGSVTKGLYVYYQMPNVAPSGTQSSSSKSAAATSQAEGTTSSAEPEPATVTVTASDDQPNTIVTVTPSSSTSTFPTTSSSSTESSSSSTDSTAKPTAAPTTTQPSLSVHTVAGQPVTVTVQNPEPTMAAGEAATHKSSNSALSSGAIAGVVVGSLAGAGVLLGFLFWFCYARRRSGASDGSYDPSIQGNLLDGRRHSKASQMSMMRNIPSSPVGAATFTDNRMNKEATLYPNGNRLSNISLQDNQDYSRPVLRLTNPD